MPGAMILLKHFDIGPLDIGDYLAIGSLFSATDSVCTLQILNQDQTPFLYSVVFGEGVVNDATSVVLFNAVHDFDLSHIDFIKALRLLGTFVYLFLTSTLLGVIAGLLSAYIIKSLYFGRVLEGSSDGGHTWNILDVQKSQFFERRFMRKTFPIASERQMCNAFRFRFLSLRDTKATTRLQIACIDLFAMEAKASISNSS